MSIQETGDLMVQTTERINQLAQSGNEMLSTFERIMSIRRDCEVMAQKTEQVKMITQERIINTLAIFKQNQDVLEKVFGETEETATGKAPKTFKEFAKDLEQKLDDRSQFEWLAEQKGGVGNIEAYLSPKQLQAYQSVTPIYENPTLNKASTEIAKIVGSEGVSIEDATRKYFGGLSKEARDDIQNAMRYAKNSPFRFVNGEFAPTSELATAISNSSWAPVLQEGSFITEAAKKAAEKEAKKSTTKQILLGDIARWGLNKWGDSRQGGLLGAVSPFVSPFYDIEEQRKKEKEDKEKAEEAEEMKGYIFPFESEESEGL
jgi:hypothetical protein